MDKIALGYLHNPWFLQFEGDAPADTTAEYLAGFPDDQVGNGLPTDTWQPQPALPAAAPDAAAAELSNVIASISGHGSGLVGTNGDADMNGPQARTTFHLDGTGIRIGIISDSFDAGGASAAAVAAEEADGDLPASVTVLGADATSGTDEGRAMAELVHKVAPGAQIYFAAAGNGESGSAQAIASLQAAGCTVIVDDISWFTEPFYQDGAPMEAAVETATSAGVSYFTSAGNQGDHYYQGTVGSFPTLEVSTGGGQIEIDLQWTQPYGSFPAGSSGSAYSLGWTLHFHGTSTVVASPPTTWSTAGPDRRTSRIAAGGGELRPRHQQATADLVTDRHLQGRW